MKPYQPAGLWQELAGGRLCSRTRARAVPAQPVHYWKRTVAPPFMVNFDSPNRETCTVRETRTNTPLQALNLMNDVTFVEAARKLAERMMQRGRHARGAARLSRIALVLARAPKHAREAGAARSAGGLRAAGTRRDREARCRVSERTAIRRAIAKLDAAELAAYTAVASLMLNLDETVTKE